MTGRPHLRSYAGVPLVLPDGVPVGSVCVLDRRPRTPTPEQLQGLLALAAVTVGLLQARRTARRLAASVAATTAAREERRAAVERFRLAFDHAPVGMAVTAPDGTFLGRGVRLALDDFGTGYSSMSYVQRLPVDILKIDKMFVDPVTGPGQGTALVEAVLKLADAVGLAAVAEGVESLMQAGALRRLGCPMAQGYAFARPAALPDLARVLAARRAGTGHPLLSGPAGLPGPEAVTAAGSGRRARGAGAG